MRRSRIALTLYTLRDFCKTPAEVAETLKKVRAIGYEAVQISGLCEMPDAELRRLLDDAGLVCCGTHEPVNDLFERPAEVAERLRTLGCNTAALPYPAGIDFADPEAVARFIRDIDAAGAALRKEGCVLCYHNHAIEFRRCEDGRLVLEAIYEDVPPENLKAEIDLHWVQRGGADPVAWCRRLAGRLPMLHLKDYGVGPDNQPTFAEVGAGNLNWDEIISAAKASGCEWFIVEQDVCPGDPFDSITQSFDFLESRFVETD